MKSRVFILLAWITLIATVVSAAERPRLLVLTDIGGDPDDQQSMIRLMLYANEFEIEGLIASASGTPGELKEKRTKPELIAQIVTAYGEVRPNLLKHADGYPTAETLLGRIKSGNSNRGREAVGEGHDTEGSRWIIAAADKSDSRPLNITIWGGQTDLAQALWRVRKDRGAEGLKQFVGKIRVYDIADQDGIADWIGSEFPGLFYVLNKSEEGRDKREAAFRGMYLGGDEALVSRDWMEENIRRDHGPLGALYPPRTWTAPNPHSAIKEGDTPSWFYFLANGLNEPSHPEWGGLGGRFEAVSPGKYRDAKESLADVTSARATVWRWREAFQAGFQARLDWCVAEEFDDANHAPIAVLNGDRSNAVLHLAARPGERIELTSAGSEDRDGDELSVRWFVYQEAGTYRGPVELAGVEEPNCSLLAPNVEGEETVHVILEVRDDGNPQLISHRRAVVTVR